ncbi:ABC transporter substrate-binding protein [Pseudonocardia abyssalis]|uniref:ABC transporter substrate-binding protein n=1 Tax=Pseudonocardia abyssalis TaxID=2792008 RepID=A0ABS6UXI2_9PSEU|nr:ABC transporter substrate-binding protein [Pseudonocardia abyssalis]MBW0113929.1 ABC transporter substrate-binding protein [Pseudonocardia abyssalis]MBW0136987.1 ABC transporter substrate-binding protein [Pseudonocardia abyssalis]
MRSARRLSAALTAGLLAVTLAACATSERDDGAAAGGSGEAGGTMVFGAPGAPDNFDPIFATDGETFRPARQMFDTLITYAQGTSDLAPGLATEWTPNAEGTEWTFALREGVTFHDGTPFDAAAVCFNFDRWFNLPNEAAQSQAIYYTDTFGGYANNLAGGGDPVYNSCEAPDASTAVIKLNRNKGAFPAAFGLTSLSISSPTALQQYDADTIEQSGEAFTYSAYATEHPTGTGPFKFESYDRAGGTITLVRNDDYWGEPALLDRLIFRVIPDENARRQELQAGTIDGYDLPSPADWAGLEADGNQVLVRPPFNVLYLGINQKNNPALQDVRVRQAIGFALDRESLVRNQLPEGASVATQFMPDTVAGYADDIQAIPYDPERARQLLAEAGQSNLTLNFYYPTEVTRPYMPNPTNIFTALSENLRQVGITVNAVAQPWAGGYLDSVNVNGVHDLHIIGWTGDYNDAGNFVGTFFGAAKPEFGFTNDALFGAITAADATVDPAAKDAAYEQVNRDIMAYLPAIPISSSPPAVVVSEAVTGLIPSPLTDERFLTVSKN